MAFSPILSLFILLIIYPSFTKNQPSSLSALQFFQYVKQNQLQFLRDFNLQPSLEVEIFKAYDNSSSELVEKLLSFQVLGDSGATVSDLAQHAGFFRLQNTIDARMFYLFFESRKAKTDPVVIWLTGGPGCSSQLALFYENGPFKIASNLSLIWNDYGWDKVSNIIFVDQPTGTGFSYSSSDQDTRHDENGVSNDLYNFLKAFFKAHPDYVNNDFYITGESYAGHYIPAFATRISLGNKNNEGIHINLKGFGIGNGLTNPGIQYPAYTEFALANKIISISDYNKINQQMPACEQAIKQCGTTGTDICYTAYNSCQQILFGVINLIDNMNYYDIRKKCEGRYCYDFSNVEQFLEQSTVKTALGVPDTIRFVPCNDRVYVAMINDWMRNLDIGIPALLEENIQMLVYAGEYDLICNWLGNWRWVHAMSWAHQKQFIEVPNATFFVDGKEAGLLKNYGPLTFLKVHDAGHMVPMDQPKVALRMLELWTTGKLNQSAVAPV